MSILANGVAFEKKDLTPRGPIDEKLFRVVAEELQEQREQFRTLALARESNGHRTLHLKYEHFAANATDTLLRRVMTFIGHSDADVTRLLASVQTTNDDGNGNNNKNTSTRIPLKNTNENLNASITNVYELARIAREFPYIAPSLDREVRFIIQFFKFITRVGTGH
jgi:hypothetical protein